MRGRWTGPNGRDQANQVGMISTHEPFSFLVYIVKVLDERDGGISALLDQHAFFHEVDHLGRDLVISWQFRANFLMNLANFGQRPHAVVEATSISATLEGFDLVGGLFAELKVFENATVTGDNPCEDLGGDRTK